MTALETIGSYGAKIDIPARQMLAQPGELYSMLQYFMGYVDERFSPLGAVAGKRTRPGLLLYLAEAFGSLGKALPAAVSIELFHNFTLIHDDIEDHDETRRGRPTVWKLWGVNKALNAGDAQVILALETLAKDNELSTEVHLKLQQFLLHQYRLVIEGQHLDFDLTEASLDSASVTESAYRTMIGKKSAALIAASAKAAGIIAERSETELEALYAFGWNLGLAYQLYDDRQSIWASTEKTGKDAAGDIRERKKTLPIIYARDTLPKASAQIFCSYYADPNIETESILALLEEASAQEYIDTEIEVHKKKAIESLRHLSISEEQRELLKASVEELLS